MAYSKYRAKKAIIDGITFASQKEARRYQELKLLEKDGRINTLHCQIKYELLPKTQDFHALNYIADFAYYTFGEGMGYKLREFLIVEDVKGYRGGTAYAIFKIKKRLMFEKYGIMIQEV
jgi:hypothetical protein